MPYIDALMKTASTIDPLTLAVLFIGLISLGVIGLAYVAIAGLTQGTKK